MSIPDSILDKILNIYSNITKTNKICIDHIKDNLYYIYFNNDTIKIFIYHIKSLNMYDLNERFYTETNTDNISLFDLNLQYYHKNNNSNILDYIRHKTTKNNIIFFYDRNNIINTKIINDLFKIEYISEYIKKITNNKCKYVIYKKKFINNWYLMQLIKYIGIYNIKFNYYVFKYYIYCLKIKLITNHNKFINIYLFNKYYNILINII